MVDEDKKSKKSEKDGKSRKLRVARLKRRKVKKNIKASRSDVASAFKIMRLNLKHIFKHKKLFVGIAFVYYLASLILVNSIAGTSDYTEIKRMLNEALTGFVGQISTGITLFGMLLSSGETSASSEAGSVFQTILLIIISLATIWAFRQTYAKAKVSLKDSFYKSMTPLIPFILVLLVLGLQIMPATIGTSLYSWAISQGAATTFVEKAVWLSIVLSLITLTIYMVCSSVFALYIVTLPGVTPLQALRSARELVSYRRWTVIRKVLFLPICLILIGALIMIPILLYVTIIAQWVFIFLTMAGVVVAHGYIYKLYRELM